MNANAPTDVTTLVSEMHGMYRDLLREVADIDLGRRLAEPHSAHVAYGRHSKERPPLEQPKSRADLNLLRAAHEGWVSSIKRWLDEGANINVATQWGTTPLLLAMNQEHLPAVALLLERGADAAAGHPTPLQRALILRSAPVIQLLQELGKVVPTAEEAERIVQMKHEKAAEALRKAIVNHDLDSIRRVEREGVALAVAAKHSPLLNTAIAATSDPKHRELPDRDAIVDLLLAAGADVNGKQFHRSPLATALESGRYDLALKLLQAGADPNQANERIGPPLVGAIERGDLEAVKLLREHGADLARSLNYGNELHVAVREMRGDPQAVAAMVNLLLELGVDRSKVREKKTPLQAARAAMGWNSKHFRAVQEVFAAHEVKATLAAMGADAKFDPR